MREKRNDRGALSVILLAIFIDLVCNGILVPIVPQLLGNPDSLLYILPVGYPVSVAYVLLGLLIATFPFFMFISTPIMGEISDYVGRKKVLMVALVGTGMALTLLSIGVILKSLTILFIARIIGGILGGTISVAQAAVADITPKEKRTARFGLIGAAYGFGFIVGPVVGGVFSDSSLVPWFNASTPFLCAAILAYINGILVAVFLRETRWSNDGLVSMITSIDWKKSLHHIVHAYNMKDLRPIFVTNFLFQSGVTLFGTFFSVYLISKFGFNQVAVGYYIGYAGIWMIISQGLLLRILSKKWEEVALLRIFLLLGTASIFLYYLPDGIILLYIVGALFALTNAIPIAALPSLASKKADADNQGEVLGINSSVQALAQVIPPVIAGFLAAKIDPSAPIYASGVVVGLAWMYFMLEVRGKS